MMNAPQLFLGLELYYQAWMELDSDRRSTMSSPGRIPWSAIDRYCERLELEPEQAEDMFYHMAALDDEFLEYHRKKSKAAEKQGVIGGKPK